MRTTEAERYARWSVTVAALLAVMVVCAYVWRAWEARQAQSLAPPPVPEAVQQRSQEFTFSKVDGNNTRFIVRASHATEFKEGGRTLLEDVWITTFGGNGRRSDQLHTRACEYLAPSGTVTCPEEVLIDLQGHPDAAAASGGDDAAEPAAGSVRVVTSHLSFQRETGIATSDDPVQFRFPQGEGRAVGLRYDSQRGELHLLREVELVLRTASEGADAAPEAPPADPMTIASEFLYRRDDRMIQLMGAARMRRGRQELQSGAMTIELDKDFAVQRLIAREQPLLHDPLGDSDVSLAADEISAPLESSGRLQGVVATGNVVLNALRADGRHQLTGASAILDLVPESQQPRHFSAAGNVVVVSRLQDGSMRHLETPQLEVEFDPGEVESHVQRATAQSATMEWGISARGPARAPAETMRMKGQVLDGTFDAAGELRELRGTGGVEVQKIAPGETPMTSTSRELLARISEGGEWSTVDQTGGVRLKNASGDAQAERAHFDRAADTTTLTGSVLLTDASSQTRAQTATFHESANELRAEGNVSTTELAKRGAPAAAKGAQSEPAHISSSRMTANTAAGRAVYTGKARLWQGASVIQADSIDLDRSKHVLVATGNVNAVFPEAQSKGVGSGGRGEATGVPSSPDSWRAEAERMTYEESQHRARLEQRAHARSTDGDIHAERIDLFFASEPGTAGTGSGSLFGDGLESQQVERAQGFGSVQVQSAGRTGTGERADYSAAESKFILSGGHPKLIDEFGNSTAGRQLTFFFSDDRILVDSEEGSRTLTLHRVEK